MMLHQSYKTVMASIAFIAACSPSSTHHTALAYNPSSSVHESPTTPLVKPPVQDRRSVLSSASAASMAAVASPLLLGNPSSASAAAVASAPATAGPKVPLDGSAKGFPLASFGLQVYDDDTAYRLTLTALEVGYRNFFASVLAGNQRGFAKAIKASGIPRDELFVCGTVLSNRARGEEAAFIKTKQGCQENMNAFSYGDLIKLDQIMLDYPAADADSIRGQWRAFEAMKSEGLVDTLAVSNFNSRQLDAILTMGEGVTKPAVNQLPFSVAYHPPGILDYNKERGVLVQSWSPLSRVLTNPTYRSVLASVGNEHGKTPAQVGLRWIIQNGASFCTQSKSKGHFAEDLNVFDFELSTEEMNKLSQLASA